MPASACWCLKEKKCDKRKERSSNVRKRSIAICQSCTLVMNVADAALLSHDVLQVPAVVMLALSLTPVAIMIRLTIVIHSTLFAGIIIIVLV